MKLLAEITEVSLGVGGHGKLEEGTYRNRTSARAILFREDGRIAIQYLRTYTFHKLPGGGVEEGESIEEALVREVKEEVGCACIIVRPVGYTIEHRYLNKLLHTSYCFEAQVAGPLENPTLETGEVEEGQETVWMYPEEVLVCMKRDVPGKFEGHFILKREIAFLEEYLCYEKS